MVKQQLSDGGDNMGTHAHIGYIENGKIHLKSNQDATTSRSRGGMIRISFKNKRFPTLFY